MTQESGELHLIPAREARAETRVINSRFIATVAPVFSVEEAREFTARIRGEFSDAAHNVSAYLIGHGMSVVAHSHDDGEPAGTAGRPALAVLQGSGLGDAAVVVTRYFGGAKLGTGGLVRAYRDAVRNALAVTPRAARVATHTALVTAPYSLYERVCLLIADHHGLVLHPEFAAEVTVTVRLAVDDFAAFQSALQEMSGGLLSALIVETDPATIVPY